MTNNGVAWVDTVYDILSNARRRHVLYVVEEYDSLSVEQLTRRIADRETADHPESEDAMQIIKTTLLHNHLPQLAAHDFIEYDENQRLVETGCRFDDLKETVTRAKAFENGLTGASAAVDSD